MQTILITGGVGYVGTHVSYRLLSSGFHVVVIDSLVASSCAQVEKLQRRFPSQFTFVKGDIRDAKVLSRIFNSIEIDAVIHLAALKDLNNSKKYPIEYYDVNICGSINLLQTMNNFGVQKIIFSSSAAIYTDSALVPFREDCAPTQSNSPYANSKLCIERILNELIECGSLTSAGVLRFFNPIGACRNYYSSDPQQIEPSNLVPVISSVAIGRRDGLTVFGKDFPTKDGTGIRDYIHVLDVAESHCCALNFIEVNDGFNCWNIGSGKGYSVLEVIDVFRKVTGKQIPFSFSSRRPGDAAQSWADISLAAAELGWYPRRALNDMVVDQWHWEQSSFGPEH